MTDAAPKIRVLPLPAPEAVPVLRWVSGEGSVPTPWGAPYAAPWPQSFLRTLPPGEAFTPLPSPCSIWGGGAAPTARGGGRGGKAGGFITPPAFSTHILLMIWTKTRQSCSWDRSPSGSAHALVLFTWKRRGRSGGAPNLDPKQHRGFLSPSPKLEPPRGPRSPPSTIAVCYPSEERGGSGGVERHLCEAARVTPGPGNTNKGGKIKSN